MLHLPFTYRVRYMNKLKVYKISEDYIAFLREKDSINVKVNKEERRPYIGVVLEIEQFKYFAPLASPKAKHQKMKNTLDFIKMNGGKLGAINLNNMIPVVDSALIPFHVEQEEEKYRNLLYNQIKFLNANKDMICKKAKRLYISVTVHHSYLEKRCAKFKELEKKSKEWKRC